MSRYAYPNPGEAEAVLKQALALLDLFKGIPDPAAGVRPMTARTRLALLVAGLALAAPVVGVALLELMT